MADDLIQPKSGATPAPAETPQQPAQTSEGGIPKEVAQVPAMQAVLAGAPPAVSTPVKNEDPALKKVWDARQKLQDLGIGFYRSLAGDTGVIFNYLRLSPEKLVEADKAGKLQEIAPPYDVVNKTLLSNPSQNPLLNVQPMPENFPADAPGAPAQSASASALAPSASNGSTPPGAPASVLNKLQGTRQDMVKPGGPTSGLKPGAGRVMNALLKPVV